MELYNSDKAYIKFVIWNSDGSIAAMCGNALRIITSYCLELESKLPNEIQIESKAGLYQAHIENKTIWIEMDVNHNILIPSTLEKDPFEKCFAIDTGVPHVVLLGKNIQNLDIMKLAPQWRFHPHFTEGANVNFVEITDFDSKKVRLRTYERGVEAETFSCGTGIAATSLALKKWFNWNSKLTLETKGGEHQVKYINDKLYFSGVVKKVFTGIL
jgi:diaminopimelate epimerase